MFHASKKPVEIVYIMLWRVKADDKEEDRGGSKNGNDGDGNGYDGDDEDFI